MRVFVRVCALIDLIGNDTSVGGHNFKVHSFITPHFCDVCGRLLWGLVSQAVKCRGRWSLSLSSFSLSLYLSLCLSVSLSPSPLSSLD